MTKDNKPPKILEKLLEYFTDDTLGYSAMGDYGEMYFEITAERGIVAARLWYIFQIIKALTQKATHSIRRSLAMFQNYLKVAFRNIIKSKGYAFINIFGLSIGIACCILIFFFIRYEYTYDQFHEGSERIYRVGMTVMNGDAVMDNLIFGYVPPLLANILRVDYPEVEYATSLESAEITAKYGNEVFKDRVHFGDGDIFFMFDFPLEAGVPETVFETPNSIVISQRIKDRYFGRQNPVGETIRIKFDENFLNYTVTGVLKEFPGNTSISFDMLIPHEKLAKKVSRVFKVDWNSPSGEAYIKFKNGVSAENFIDKLPNLVEKYAMEPNMSFSGGLRLPGDLLLAPISTLHFDDMGIVMEGAKGNPRYSFVLGGIAVLVLVIACINFMNLTIGQSMKRSKEVGMRKVFGAKRKQLIWQFLNETVIMSLFALVLGMLLAEMFLPAFNTFSKKGIVIDYTSNFMSLLFLGGLVFTIGLASGSYPALVLSGYEPMGVLRKMVTSKGSTIFTRSLIVIQFSISIVLIISSLIMFDQIQFMLNRDLGFNKDQVLVIDTNFQNANRAFSAFKEGIDGKKGIVSVSGTYGSVLHNRNVLMYKKGEVDEFISMMYVDLHYFETLGIELIDGRMFTSAEENGSDKFVIVNEAFLKEYGIKNPLGKDIGNEREINPKIIGVVKDFHLRSVSGKIEPVLIGLLTDDLQISKISLKIEGEEAGVTLRMLEEEWKKAVPNEPFIFSFLDDEVQMQFEDNKNWSNIIWVSTLFALLIASLGLLGITSLTIGRRIKEISIRKVLGSTSLGLVAMVNREFILLIILANIIAWPVAYLFMNQWLQKFAFRTPLDSTLFVAAAVATTLLAVITISIRAINAAFANPVDSIRHE